MAQPGAGPMGPEQPERLVVQVRTLVEITELVEVQGMLELREMGFLTASLQAATAQLEATGTRTVKAKVAVRVGKELVQLETWDKIGKILYPTT